VDRGLVGLMGISSAVSAGWARPASAKSRLVLGTTLILAAGGATAGTVVSGRSQANLEHVYVVRILPYPGRLQWFE
jgi:hypothetical protein